MAEVEDANVVVRGMLQQVSLTAINFLEVSMVRKPGEPVGPGLTFPSQLELAHQVVENAVVYKVQVTVDRPDLTVTAALAIMYVVPDVTVFEDNDVQRTFGERIALPACYPFLRSKIFEMTTDCGAPPVMLNLIDLGRHDFGALVAARGAPAP